MNICYLVHSIKFRFVDEFAPYHQVCHSERSVSKVEESTHFQHCLAVFWCEDPSIRYAHSG